jgi:hypothetical protein
MDQRKTCEHCQASYRRAPRRSDQQWSEQRFCSDACKNAWHGNQMRGQPRPTGTVGVGLW